jgi:exonuclease III
MHFFSKTPICHTSRGVGVLLYDIDATVKEISSDDVGRILSCELKYENKTYIITNVYCPNDSGVRKTFIPRIIIITRRITIYFLI